MSKTGDALDVLATLARRDAGDEVVPYARFRRPWNVPSRPVSPWTTSFVSLPTTIAISDPSGDG